MDNKTENTRLICSCCGAELNTEDYYEIVLVKQNCNNFPQKDQAIRFCQGVRPLLNE